MVRTRVFLAAWLLSIGQAAIADVLVLTDGERVETRGPWQVRGRVVVFTAPDGKLSSMRTSGVDIDRSRQASDAPDVAEPLPSSGPKPPVASPPSKRRAMVLTNADLRSTTSASQLSDGRNDESAPPLAPTKSRLAVDSWREIKTEDGGILEIVGTLSNRGSAIESVVTIAVELPGLNGRQGQRIDAVPEERVLAPGSSTTFRVTFYGVGRDHGRPVFEIESEPSGGQGSVNSAALGR